MLVCVLCKQASKKEYSTVVVYEAGRAAAVNVVVGCVYWGSLCCAVLFASFTLGYIG